MPEIKSKNTGNTKALYSCRLLAVILFILLLLPAGGKPALAGDTPEILILNSYHDGYLWSEDIMAGIESEFAGQGVDAEFFIEYMDTKRYRNSDIFPLIEKLYEFKLDHAYDLVIVSDNNALDFLLAHRDEFLPATPVVFCGINNYRHDMISGEKNITGVAEQFDLEENLRLALKMYPGTRYIATISDPTKSAKENEKQLNLIKPKFRGRVSFIELYDLSTAELSSALGSLPENTVILCLSFMRDRTGKVFSSTESMAFINGSTSLPVFVAWDHMVASGALGGVVVSGRLQGQRAARIALEILGGRPANDIPVVTQSPNIPMFNYVQMKRLGLSPRDIPENAVILEKPLSFYEVNKKIVWIVVSALIVQCLTIIFLVVNRVHRRRAEDALRLSEAKFVRVFEKSPNPMLLMNAETRTILSVNASFTKIIGCSSEGPAGDLDLMGTRLADAGAWEDLISIVQTSASISNHEISFIDTKNETRFFLTFAEVLNIKGNGFYIFTFIDITDKKLSEATLRESEEKYRLLVETMNEGLVILGKDGSFAYANDFFCRMLGSTRQELIGTPAGNILDEKSRPVFNRRLSDQPEAEEGHYELTMITKAGRRANTIIAPKAIHDGQGNFQGNFAVITDITKQKAAEGMLRQRIRFEASLSEISARFVNLPVEETDREIRASLEIIGRHFNIRQYRIFQNSTPDGPLFETHNWTETDSLKPVNTERDLPWCCRQAATGKSVVISLGTLLPEQAGKERAFLDREGFGSLICVPLAINGRFNGMILAVRDFGNRARIDEIRASQVLFGRILGNVLMRKESETALKRTKQLLETVLAHTPVMVAYLDPLFNYEMVNAAYAEWYQKVPSFFPGKNFFDLYPEKEAEQLFTRVVKTGEPLIEYARQVDHKNPGRPGRIFWDLSLIPITSRNNEVIGLVLSILDVSERKVHENNIIQADKMASLGVLVAGVAHEINNPNNFISLNTPFLDRAWRSATPILEEYYDENGEFSLAGIPYSNMRERLPRLISGIIEGTQRINRIVTDLKHFAQPEHSRYDETVDINSVVRSSLNLIGNMVKKHTDHFTVDYGINLPVITGSYQRLEQVVINLVQNACYALTDRGQPVSVRTFHDTGVDAVKIEVADQGKGIPNRHLPSLMDPFFTTRRDEGGTGLGLSVSSTIIREHSGQILVESHLDKGSVFTVSLPCNRDDTLKKVLVVDDDSQFREMIAAQLGATFRCRVEESENGIECCIKLGTFQPDLLIIDIHMPDMNGVEVCRKIRSDPGLSDIQVVVITGDSFGRETEELRKMGYDRILEKPYNPETFYSIVENVLTKGE
ncbi:MAG: PAS domain S-box protein [Desulfobacterales bacterium]|nr:PAS domain S-box protein [Desulfobacterales bacterium]